MPVYFCPFNQIHVQIQMSEASTTILEKSGGFNYTSRGVVQLPKV